MALILPLDKFHGRSSFNFTMQLSGSEYLLEFRFHERIASWYMDVYLPDGTPVFLGIRLVTDYPLLANRKSPLFPSDGEFLCLDTRGEGEDCTTLDGLGSRFGVVYLLRSEVGR